MIIAAVLVMFMQAGFAFLEAGLTRMKNVGHIAAKSCSIFAFVFIVYYLVGFGIAFGVRRQRPRRRPPAVLLSHRRAADGRGGSVLVVHRDSGGGRLPVRGRLLRGVPGDRVGRDGGADEALGLLRLRRLFTLIYSVASHRIWSPDGWLFSRGMEDFAGSTVVHDQGRCGTRRCAPARRRIGKFGADGKLSAIPGHNMAFTTLGVIILWFGWFGFNSGRRRASTSEASASSRTSPSTPTSPRPPASGAVRCRGS